jgi:hypothetical protein
MHAAAPPTTSSRGDRRLLADLRSIEALVVGPSGHPVDRLELALGQELANKLVFALARRRGASFRKAAA